jgi:hypothetical protein
VPSHTGVLVSLQHELRDTRVRIPELDTTVLRSTEHPVAVRRKSDTEYEVLYRNVSGQNHGIV